MSSKSSPMCKVIAMLVLAGVLAFSPNLPNLLAGGKRSDSEVKVTATASKPGADGEQVVTVKMNINKGWHIYANPVGNGELTSAQTTVKIAAKTAPKDVKVDFPKGKVKEDKLVGNYLVYEDQVTIKAKVHRAEGDTSPLEVTVGFMACHAKGVCLTPAKVKLTVP
jgi:DsbC/DsbD-like thiol-disulfide interchange protein